MKNTTTFGRAWSAAWVTAAARHATTTNPASDFCRCIIWFQPPLAVGAGPGNWKSVGFSFGYAK
jgi:hypothetical protein